MDQPEQSDGQSQQALEAFAEQIVPLLRPDVKDQGIQLVQSFTQKIHVGPLPPADELYRYDQAHPGTAERVVAMAEKEQNHRHAIDNRVITGEFRTRFIGQVGAIITVLALVGLAGFCVWMQQTIAASVVVAIGGAGAVFLKHTAQRLIATGNDRSNENPAKKQKPPQRRAVKNKR